MFICLYKSLQPDLLLLREQLLLVVCSILVMTCPVYRTDNSLLFCAQDRKWSVLFCNRASHLISSYIAFRVPFYLITFSYFTMTLLLLLLLLQLMLAWYIRPQWSNKSLSQLYNTIITNFISVMFIHRSELFNNSCLVDVASFALDALHCYVLHQ